MKLVDLVRALAYPVTESVVLIPLLVFWLLTTVAIWGGLFGLFLVFLIVLPAVIRFQMILLEARAKGVTPATPDIGSFNWFGKAWTMFPFLIVVCLTWTTIAAGRNFGTAWVIPPVLFAAAFFPASVAVLAITHSPLQSVNPLALGRLWKTCRSTFWLATVFLIVAVWLAGEATTLPGVLANLVSLLLSFAFFSLVGSLIQPYGLIANIEIPAPLEKDAAAEAADLNKVRSAILDHAYGFISRDNRAAGLNHILDWIDKDPHPVTAWAWFFEQMLRWENREPAMFFAQHYLHDQLQHGEQTPAVKLMMRCRLVDERFRPWPEDVPAATLAAESCGNEELAAVLSQN